MNERDALRYASRRAALIDSLRRRDTTVAARAAARLRIPNAPMVSSEFGAARDARLRLGRAIIRARLPKAEAAPLRREEAIIGELPSRKKWYALAAAAAAVALIVVFGTGVGLQDGGGGAPPETSASEAQRTAVLTVSRGRTIAAPVEIVAVQESPTPAPTVEPTPEATAVPTATARATTGSGTGGGTRTGSPAPTGSGTGSGSGSGGGIGILPRTPTPIPTVTPPVPPPGYGRFSVIVLDASTGRPLPDVCVVLGTASCGPNQPHTDANGRWSADVPVTSVNTSWDMYFIKAGYITQYRKLTLAAGRTVTFQILLRRG